MDVLADLFSRLTELIDSLASLVTDSPFTYVVIFALTAIDPVLPILPAEAAVTAAAVLAGQGQLSLAAVIVAAGLGAFVGDNIAYWIGRSAGRPVIQRIMRGRTDQLEAVERQFTRRGGIFVIIGRFIPGGRTTVSIGAGALHFDWLRFMAYDALAAVIWSIQAALPGYIGGVVVADKPWLAMVVGFGLSIAVGVSIALFQHWWGRRHRSEGDVTVESAIEDTEGAAVQPPSTTSR